MRTFERHVLDEPNRDIHVTCELDKGWDLRVVKACNSEYTVSSCSSPPARWERTSNNDAVDLRVQPLPLQSSRDLQRIHDRLKSPPSRDKLVLERVQRVERYVEMREASLDERRELALECDTVRGHPERIQAELPQPL